MPALSFPFAVLLASALLFAYLVGVTDSANIVAPVVSVQAMSLRGAMLMTIIATLVAPFVFGLAVARAYGAGILHPGSANLAIVIAGTLGAIAWRFITWRLGIPSSSSHALIGGLVGAGLMGSGTTVVNWPGLIRVLTALFISPAIGLLAGYVLTHVIYFLAQGATPRVNVFFRQAQITTALALAFSWGANDAQNTIGLLALGLAAASGAPFSIPNWAIWAAMAALALGALTGGWRLIRTLGGRFYRIRPIHGLAAQVAAASVILGAALVGRPVSTTQVVSTAIMGAGAGDRVSQVRWGVALDILWAWLLTIPATALLGASLFWLLHRWL
jgi:PiT family inorganic phosphate transporter